MPNCSLIAKKLPQKPKTLPSAQKFAQCPIICLINTQQFAQCPKVCSQETQMFAYCVNDCQYSKIYKTLICRKNSISLALARIFSSPQATMQSFFCSIQNKNRFTYLSNFLACYLQYTHTKTFISRNFIRNHSVKEVNSLWSTFAHCLKITQNVAFEFLNFGISTNFCPIKIDLSGNTV